MEDLSFLRGFKTEVDIISHYNRTYSTRKADKKEYNRAVTSIFIRAHNELSIIKKQDSSSNDIIDAKENNKKMMKWIVLAFVLGSIIWCLSFFGIIWIDYMDPNSRFFGLVLGLSCFGLCFGSLAGILLGALLLYNNNRRLIVAYCIAFAKNPLLGDPSLHPHPLTPIIRQIDNNCQSRTLLKYNTDNHLVILQKCNGQIELCIDNNVYAAKKGFATTSCLLQACIEGLYVKYSCVNYGKKGFYVYLYVNDELVIERHNFFKLSEL